MRPDLKKKAEMATALQRKVEELRSVGESIAALKVEKDYLKLRLEVVEEVTKEIGLRRSVPIRDVIEEVNAEPPRPRQETGIRSLDMQLANWRDRQRGVPGGFELGNFIQIAGNRGSGKTSFLMKILTNISTFQRVVWFDFEMGKRRVVEKLKDFKLNPDNLYYYAGSRDVGEIIDEIKLHYADGARHFVIDSTMKLTIRGVHDRFERFSEISRLLSELCADLGINIYIINQMSQSSVREGELSLKHGNDAEYNADFIFYLLAIKKQDERGEVERDEYGQIVYDEGKRILRCAKNRQDDHLFTVEITKSEIFGPKTIVYEYE